jgi:hypothetical protein
LVEQFVPTSGFLLLESAFSLNPQVARAVDGLLVHAPSGRGERLPGDEFGMERWRKRSTTSLDNGGEEWMVLVRKQDRMLASDGNAW